MLLCVFCLLADPRAHPHALRRSAPLAYTHTRTHTRTRALPHAGTDVVPLVPALEKIWADSMGQSLEDFNFRWVVVGCGWAWGCGQQQACARGAARRCCRPPPPPSTHTPMHKHTPTHLQDCDLQVQPAGVSVSYPHPRALLAGHQVRGGGVGGGQGRGWGEAWRWDSGVQQQRGDGRAPAAALATPPPLTLLPAPPPPTHTQPHAPRSGRC